MAKAAVIRRNEKRKKECKRLVEKRELARDINKDPNATFEEKLQAQKLLQKTRNGSKIRLRNRCNETGRPRGVSRKFGICNKKLREAMNNGDIPGLTKSSW